MSVAASDLHFPPVCHADDDGLLMIGGELTRDRLLEAYQHGIFPWPIVERDVEVLSWWSPDPRAILQLDRLHVPRRLARRIRSRQFEVTLNQDFEVVISQCAMPRNDGGGSWITPSLLRAYMSLHRAGYAHSVEVRRSGRLVGGLYGVALGGYFAGESMFCRHRDASKIAIVYLVHRLLQQGFQLFDIQQWSPHMGRLGATEIPRTEFLTRLEQALRLPVSLQSGWPDVVHHPGRMINELAAGDA